MSREIQFDTATYKPVSEYSKPAHAPQEAEFGTTTSSLDTYVNHPIYTTIATATDPELIFKDEYSLPENKKGKKKKPKNDKKTIKTKPGGKTNGGYRNEFMSVDTITLTTMIPKPEISINDSPLQESENIKRGIHSRRPKSKKQIKERRKKNKAKKRRKSQRKDGRNVGIKTRLINGVICVRNWDGSYTPL